jgi:hypothetical protein
MGKKLAEKKTEFQQRKIHFLRNLSVHTRLCNIENKGTG